MYTFLEPSVTEDLHSILLMKEDGQISEETIVVVVTVSSCTLDNNFQSATQSTRLANGSIVNNDFSLFNVDRTSQVIALDPTVQQIPIYFSVFKDELPEGTEVFCISFLPEVNSPLFTPSAVLHPKTSIIIVDDDSKENEYKPIT